MVEQQKRRLEGAISDMIEDMYRTHLRRMQVILHFSLWAIPIDSLSLSLSLIRQVHNASLRRRLL